jgi:hypothetical protein
MSTFGTLGKFQNNLNDLTLLLQNKSKLDDLNNEINIFSNNFDKINNNSKEIIFETSLLNEIELLLANNLSDISNITENINKIIIDNSTNEVLLNDISSVNNILINEISNNTSKNNDLSLLLSPLVNDISININDISINNSIISELLSNNGYANLNEINNNSDNLNLNNLLIQQNINDISNNTNEIIIIKDKISSTGLLDISNTIDIINKNNLDISNNISDISQIIIDNSQNIQDTDNNDIIIDDIPAKNKLFAVQRNRLSSLTTSTFQINFDNLIINELLNNSSNELQNNGTLQFNETGKYLITMQCSIEHLIGGSAGNNNFIQFYRNDIFNVIPGSKTNFNVYDNTKIVYNQIKFLLNVTSTSDTYFFLMVQSAPGRLEIIDNTCRLLIEKFE